MIINGKYENYPLPGDYWLAAEGVFETLRTYENRAFAVNRHLDRLELGIRELGLVAPDRNEVEESITKLLAMEKFPNGRLRIVIAGDATWTITHQEYRPSQAGLNCSVIRRSVLPELKSPGFKRTQYRSRLQIQQDALDNGFDDALLVSGDGYFIEGTVCNLIFEIDGSWVTPDLSSGCLPGVTRELLIENFGVRESKIALGDLDRVKSVAFTSSLREIQAIKAIDGQFFAETESLKRFQDIFHSWILGNLSL